VKLLPILVAAFMATPAFCAERQFKSGGTFAVDADDAYVLLRTFQVSGGGIRGPERFSPILVRVVAGKDLEIIQSFDQEKLYGDTPGVDHNVVEPNVKIPFAESNGEEFVLISLKPGTYVVAGVTVATRAMKRGVSLTCLCMGTVKFEDRAGVVTDLGALLVARDDQPTDIPELSNVVSGKRRGFGAWPPQIAIRVATKQMEMPPGLGESRVVAAEYEPVGALPNYIGAAISRLAPIPGILSYDKDGEVIGSSAHSQGRVSPSPD